MLKDGEDTGLPETYRIALALSVAFLAHTLFMATFPFDLPEHQYNPVTVEVQLTPEGSAPSQERAASTTQIATPFAIETSTAEPSAPDTVSSVQEQDTSVPEPTSDPLISPPSGSTARPRPQSETSTSISALASTLSSAGQPRSVTKTDQPETITQKSENPSEEASYRAQLARTIGEKGGVSKRDLLDLGIKAKLEERETITVGVSLRLMTNGTLVDAKISEPSGFRELDLLIYKAALEASPYPEPPEALRDQRWFSVTLKARDF